MISVKAGRPIVVCGKNVNVAIFSGAVNFLGRCKYDKCQTLRDGSTHLALPIHTTFSDLDCISRSQECHTVLRKILCSYVIKLKLCMTVDNIT